MTELEASRLEADRILRDAGWTLFPGWQGFARETLVGGVQPDGMAAHIKDWAKIQPGHPLYGPDTPDEPHEAAAWLVARYNASLASEGEPGDSAAHEAHGETGAQSDDQYREHSQRDTEHPEPTVFAGTIAGGCGEGAPSEIHDADFTEVDFAALQASTYGDKINESLDEIDQALSPRLLTEDIKDFVPDEIAEEDHGPGAFIFGDNLEQKRTAAIGVVVQMALERLPVGVSYAALSELRNFSMGVTEGRWPDDPAKRDELDAMEALERRRRMVEAVRDEKVGFLVNANREEIEGFDPGEGWP